MKLYLYAFIITCTLLLSCNDNKKNSENSKKESNLIKGYEYVHLIPDSLLTTEQTELKKLIQNVIIENVSIENNHFVFKLSKEEFINRGIPEPYYELLIINIQDNNHFIDSIGIENMDSILKESYRQF